MSKCFSRCENNYYYFRWNKTFPLGRCVTIFHTLFTASFSVEINFTLTGFPRNCRQVYCDGFGKVPPDQYNFWGQYVESVRTRVWALFSVAMDTLIIYVKSDNYQMIKTEVQRKYSSYSYWSHEIMWFPYWNYNIHAMLCQCWHKLYKCQKWLLRLFVYREHRSEGNVFFRLIEKRVSFWFPRMMLMLI